MTKLKALAKAVVPKQFRLLRYTLYERIRYYPELLFSLGRRLECPICGWKFRRMRPGGFDYPVLTEKRVVGASYHYDEVCPRCLSNSRERLLFLYLRTRPDFFSEPKHVLHIAPEPNLGKILRQNKNIKYITADLYEPNVMTRVDVMQMPFSDHSFDVVICNHVLEHVSNDKRAMSELYRILRPGGWAVLQVPVALALETTIEDPTATTDLRRIDLFGQRDHVRLYAQGDYVERLKSIGFTVVVEQFALSLMAADVPRYALTPEEVIFVAFKPNYPITEV